MKFVDEVELTQLPDGYWKATHTPTGTYTVRATKEQAFGELVIKTDSEERAAEEMVALGRTDQERAALKEFGALVVKLSRLLKDD